MSDFNVGDIARYRDGKTSLFRIERIHGDRCYGDHVLGSMHVSSSVWPGNMQPASDADLALCRALRPDWFAAAPATLAEPIDAAPAPAAPPWHRGLAASLGLFALVVVLTSAVFGIAIPWLAGELDTPPPWPCSLLKEVCPW